jgi:hypothetical protein
MQHAKRMVLVDEKLADNLWRKQDTTWKRPAEQTVKNSLSNDMRMELNNQTLPDDMKVKQYQQMLNRFLNTKRKLPDEPLIDLTSTPLLDLETKKKKRKKKTPSFTIRRSKRKVKQPKWEEW